ncbi:hypothetical protein T310_8818, partial [Rasamsonia emersonii CBS 393.64]
YQVTSWVHGKRGAYVRIKSIPNCGSSSNMPGVDCSSFEPSALLEKSRHPGCSVGLDWYACTCNDDGPFASPRSPPLPFVLDGEKLEAGVVKKPWFELWNPPD